MKATIKQVNRTASGYDVVVELEDGKSKLFDFGNDVVAAEIKQAIRTFLQTKKDQEGNLPKLRNALIGDVIEV